MSDLNDRSHRETHPALPLLHNGDAYYIYVKDVGTKCVKIVAIHLFKGNQNVSGTEENFFDLDMQTREKIVYQINRRHVGKTVLLR